MRDTTKDRLMTVAYLAVMAAALIVGVAIAKADDVYNFYWQKAPGPATVIQQGGGQNGTQANPNQIIKDKDSSVVQQGTPESVVTSPTITSTPLTVSPPVATTAAPAPVSALPSLYDSRNSLIIGWAQENELEGIGLTYEYRFGKFLGLYGHVHYVYKPIDGGNWGPDAPATWGGAIGLSFTPLKIDLFDHGLLELGLVAGVMSNSHLETVELNPNVWRSSPYDFSTSGTPYYGARLNINFTNTLGIQGEVRVADNDSKQANVGLHMRF